MIFGLSFTDFNLLEGLFWLVCALISLGFLRFKIMPANFWRILALDFAFFGVSDFVEAYFPASFLD